MDTYRRLEQLLPGVMSPEKYSFRKELKNITRNDRKNMSGAEVKKRLLKLERKINNSVQRKEWRKNNIPKFSLDPELPITAKKDEIIEAIKNNSIVIISGETGSGKTTQLPKFCLAAGRGVNGIIGCTQPRRIAATSIAGRISEELGEELGKSVGYRIRFDEKTSENSFIKIMTDGMLLAEAGNDPFLNAYDTIIVDEAHERSINIDFILGILKRILGKRRDLKLIITSATIDTDKFSKAFNNAPVIEVSGKMYPVEVRYDEPAENADKYLTDYTEHAAEAALYLIKENPSGGDILVFMPTEQDIRETCTLLEKKNKNYYAVFPLYSRLPAGEQKQIFAHTSKRKIIVATNIAETSLTIPNIGYVVDTGLARMSEYSPSSGIVSMPVKAISRSSADQRMGRCGRVREGVCIRLYSIEDYEGRDRFTKPEIFRTNLAEVILKMTALRLGDVFNFPFIDKPKQQAINDGYNTLVELGAIIKNDKNISLTDRGRIMSTLPVDPKLSRILIEAGERHCLSEVLVIASMLSVQDPRERPSGKENEADEKHSVFTDRSSDFISLLGIWNKFDALYKEKTGQNRIRKYCREHFLSYNRMKDIREVYIQLSGMLDEHGIRAGKNQKRFIKEFNPLYNSIHKSILAGFLSNIANKKTDNLFLAAKQKEAMVFPGSGLFNKAKDWIVCAELVKTTKLFARIAANIKPEWIEELAGHLCEYSYRDPYWDRDKGDVYAFERVTLYGLEIVRNRRVVYGNKNPGEACRIFIREVLVEDMFTEIGLDGVDYGGSTAELFQLGYDIGFVEHNVELIRKFRNIEKRLRKKIIISRDDVYSFYEDRMHDAYNIETLDTLIRKRGGDEFLRMKDEDLLASMPDYERLADYPETISVSGVELDLVYKFNPGNADDGITVKIPVSKLQLINVHLIEPAITGLYREKIGELIKNLPKQYRRYFIPAAEAVETIVKEMQKGNPLIVSLQKFVYEKYMIEISGQNWQTEKLSEHLKLKISVIDKNGKELKSGRNTEVIIKELTEKYSADVFKKVKNGLEREDIRNWDFNELPESVSMQSEIGMQFQFYPGLAAENGKINLRIFRSREKAAVSHKAAISVLTEKELAVQLNIIKNEFTLPDELKNMVLLFGGLSSLKEMYFKRITLNNLYEDIRTKQGFIDNVNKMRSSLAASGNNIRNLFIDVLNNYKTASDRLDILKKHNKSIVPVLNFLDKIKAELNTLVPKDFLLRYNNDELASLEKYIKALYVRAERGCSNLQKDAQKENEILFFKQALEDEYHKLHEDASLKKKESLRTFFRLIEEYKISVFAPEIKSNVKISGKKLEQVLEEIRSMV